MGTREYGGCLVTVNGVTYVGRNRRFQSVRKERARGREKRKSELMLDLPVSHSADLLHAVVGAESLNSGLGDVLDPRLWMTKSPGGHVPAGRSHEFPGNGLSIEKIG